MAPTAKRTCLMVAGIIGSRVSNIVAMPVWLTTFARPVIINKIPATIRSFRASAVFISCLRGSRSNPATIDIFIVAAKKSPAATIMDVSRAYQHAHVELIVPPE